MTDARPRLNAPWLDEAPLADLLAVLGQTNAAVYDGSWAEWGQDNALPIETGAAR